MTEHQSERSGRIDKAKAYAEHYGSAYPSRSQRSVTVEQVKGAFERFSAGQIDLTIAGRIRQWREHGKLTFVQIEDASGRIQVALSQEHLVEPTFADLRYFDVGDIVEIVGKAFTTRKGEHSILAHTCRMLTKAIQPIPDEWFGLHDEEQRYRRRYVDLILRPELRDMFKHKALFWNTMRQFMIEEGFLEVETPALEATPGGADAQPFKTHHNALDLDLYLRISMGELWQKRLMVAGFEKTFEIGRQFRNEGISPEHLQDYTQMEFYWAYANYEDTMKLVERMYKHVIQATFNTLQFTIRGFDINFDTTWPRLDYVTAINERLQINVLSATFDELKQKCVDVQLSFDERLSRGRLIDMLWKYCRKTIAGPIFLINHPVAVSPLAKRKADEPALVERYQIIIAGSELGNGYTELNDPLDQAERFAEQVKLREAGDTEAQMHDLDFVEALEYGMPPTSGFGVSERLFSFLMDKPIRECVLFPLLRPKSPEIVSSVATVETPPQTVNPTATQTADPSLQPLDVGINRASAWTWLQDKVKDDNLRRHMIATEIIMERIAQHFQAASPEAWAITGLLHDIDWEATTPDQHSLVGAAWLAERKIHPVIVDAVREHNGMHGLEPATLLSKALYSLEQLTGLIIAATYVRPNRDLTGIKLSSLKKKFKDKAFAKGVDRATIVKSDQLLGLSLDQVMQLCLEAMQTKADLLGFK